MFAFQDFVENLLIAFKYLVEYLLIAEYAKDPTAPSPLSAITWPFFIRAFLLWKALILNKEGLERQKKFKEYIDFLENKKLGQQTS